MSAIQSSVGLITGIPIDETVTQLMSIASQPRNRLESRTTLLQAEQSAVDTLSSLVLNLRFSLSSLNRDSTFESRTATSSDPAALAVSVPNGSTPTVGSYQITPLRSATSHQLVSSSIGELSNALGGGDLSLRFGGRVNKGVSLSQINGGSGFESGSIKITDRSGETETIDLRAATTIDEVINTINAAEEIEVTASLDGDRIVLTDNSGGTGEFRVREVGGGTAAASLGLAGLADTSDTLTGGDIFYLSSATKLSSLNDGLGVAVNELEDVEDVVITLADGTEATVDLSNSVTLADFIDAINEHEDLEGKVTVAIGADGNRLTVTDHTTGTETFSVEGSAADDLGLDVASDSGVVTGKRLVAGLGGTLLASLNGGQGVEAGSIAISDHSGATDTVDLSSAETLNDVIEAINSAATGVTARINDDGTGILLTDESTGSNTFTVTEVDDGGTAASLGILIDTEDATYDSGTLNRSTVGVQTKLSALRGGEGIARGRIVVKDSAGKESLIDLRFTGVEEPTLGDVIEKINAAGAQVTAGINDTGDGIVLTDTAGGSGDLSVAESGGGSVASQLRLLGTSSETNSDGQQIIDGTSTFSVNLEEIEAAAGETLLTSVNGGSGVDLGIVRLTDSNGNTDTIDLRTAATVQDVIDAINEADVGVTAALNENGSGLLLTDTADGVGKLLVEDITGSAAEDLRLTNTIRTDTDGNQTINGLGLLSEGTPVELLAKRINEFDAGFAATVIFDGQGYRLSVSSEKTGVANEIVMSGAGTNLSFTEISRPADAVALFGQSGVGGVTITSDDGKFNEVIKGVNINVKQASGDPIKIDIAQNDAPLSTAINSFVSAYNSVRDNLDTVTEFDADTLTTGILFGRNEVVRVDADLSRIASGRFTSGSVYSSLESIGISLDDSGKLSINQAKLDEALATDHGGVERLFRDEEFGVVARFQAAADLLAGDETSLLSARSISLTSTIEQNQARIEDWDLSLERQRNNLLAEFYALEESISLLQSNLTAVEAIQPITVNRSSSSS